MPLDRGLTLLRGRLMIDAARSAGVRHMVVVDDRRIVHDGLVDIGVVNNSRIHIHHGGVVGEAATAPFSTGKADAHEAEAIVHPAVVANVLAPVAVKEAVMTAFKAPVWRRPKVSGLGSRHPSARNPVIAIVAVGPIAGSPHEPLFRARRLFIDHQRRRSKAYADKHSGKRRGRNDGEQ